MARSDVLDVGTQFCHSDYYRKISFTGSTGVGKWLLKESAMSMKRVRGGGMDICVVWSDMMHYDVCQNISLMFNYLLLLLLCMYVYGIFPSAYVSRCICVVLWI